MTPAHIQLLLDRVSYRDPSWRFTVEPVLRFTATLPDSRNPGATTDVDVRAPIPAAALVGKREFLRWLQSRLAEHEYHESREWLKVDGRIWDDPHA